MKKVLILSVAMLIMGASIHSASAAISTGRYSAIKSKFTDRCLTAELAFPAALPSAEMVACDNSTAQKWDVVGHIFSPQRIRSVAFPSYCLDAAGPGSMSVCPVPTIGGAVTIWDWSMQSTSNLPPPPRVAAYQLIKNTFFIVGFPLQNRCYIDYNNNNGFDFYYTQCHQATLDAKSWEFSP